MYIAVKFWSQNPDKPAAMPGDWPWLCVQEEDAAYTPAVESGEYTIMTQAAYDAHLETYRPSYDIYAATLPPQV